jgi:hypothetical protein
MHVSEWLTSRSDSFMVTEEARISTKFGIATLKVKLCFMLTNNLDR